MTKTMTKTDSKMIDATMRLFKGVLVNENNVSDSLFADVNREATKHGFIAPKDVCSKELHQWFQNKKVANRNTTFYKSWNDVISKDRFELFIDQIKHYLSTYGTDFEGEAYIPNKNPKKIPFDLYTVVKSLTEQQIIDSCEQIISSSVALDDNSIKDILTIFDSFSYEVDYSIIKNKEILMHLHDVAGTVPSDPVEMVRFLVFKCIDQTLLIKDKTTIEAIKGNMRDISKLMQDCGVNNLASVFFRFKPIFLAFKGNKNNSPHVNKIRKLANKYHKPMEAGYFETILSDEKDLVDVAKKLKTLNNFKKVVLLNSILNRLNNKAEFSPYPIRNGRLYVKKNKSSSGVSKDYLMGLYNVIYDSLIASISKKACDIVMPKNISIAMPTSAKKFMGEIPLGSFIKFSDTDNIVGIHWRKDEGARDIDLSSIDISGKKIGWNSSYYNANNSFVYSGDMTSADPEATELLYASGNFQPSVINVNLYSGEDDSKFEFFVAQEAITNLRENYMVDPNNIVFKTNCAFEDGGEKILGIVTKDVFVFQSMRVNARSVSTGSDWKQGYIEYIVNSIDNYVMLEDVLKHAGFTFVDEVEDDAMDFSNFSKEQILNLIS